MVMYGIKVPILHRDFRLIPISTKDTRPKNQQEVEYKK